MNSRPAPQSRKSLRLTLGTVLAGLFVVLGLTAAVAEWGSTQQVSVIAEAPVAASADQVISAPSPVCGKRDDSGTQPIGALTAPPRSVGDQLLAACTGTTPQFAAAQWLSFDIRPRAPTAPVAAPHLTSVLII